MPYANGMEKKRKVRSDRGTQRSEYDTRPCAACGAPVTRRVSEFRTLVFCSLSCYQSAGPEGPSNPVGKPRGRRVTVQVGETRIDSDGYVLVYLGRGAPGAYATGYALQHRLVMEQMLGRPLLPSERPHHRNGDRTDNRPQNLELWSTMQPPGQRVEDKVAFAREILALYGDEDERARYVT